MQAGTFVADKADGVLEVDGSYIGGKARNMYKDTKVRRGITGTGGIGKTAVIGLLVRNPGSGSRVHVEILPSVRRKDLTKVIREKVEPGTEIHSDALQSYSKLEQDYVHKVSTTPSAT